MEQVTQWSCGCHVPGTVQDHVECGFSQPDLVKGVPVHGRGDGTRWSFKAPSNPKHSMILQYIWHFVRSLAYILYTKKIFSYGIQKVLESNMHLVNVPLTYFLMICVFLMNMFQCFFLTEVISILAFQTFVYYEFFLYLHQLPECLRDSRY